LENPPQFLVQPKKALQLVQYKKTPKYFVMSSIKFGRFWRNLVHRILNKFSAKSYKRFPLYMNNEESFTFIIFY